MRMGRVGNVPVTDCAHAPDAKAVSAKPTAVVHNNLDAVFMKVSFKWSQKKKKKSEC